MKLGVFGGTFDPIHNGHLAAAKEAADQLGLQRVLLIPSGSPPHKQAAPEASYEDRFHMVELACGSDSRFSPSRLEAPTGDSLPHYSVDTIQRIREEGPPDQQIFFILGADAFAEVETWRRWQELIDVVEFVVVSRPGAQLDRTGGAASKRTHWIDNVEMAISSTAIRRRLGDGQAVDEWVPPSVAEYIRAVGLYRGAGRREESRRGRLETLRHDPG